MTLISIIIPTKNRNELLINAVESVINQTYKNWELYVVNDSKQKIVLNKKDLRIHLVKNLYTSGANGSRNTGINLCSGEFIAFLDDDDTWKKNKLEKQLNIMKNSNAILSYTGKNIFHKTKKTIKKKSSFKKEYFSSLASLQFHNYIGTTSSIMIKADILKQSEVSFDESVQILQDYDLYLQLSKKGKFIGIPDNLITYNIDDEIKHVSLSKTKFYQSAHRIISKQKGIYKITILMGLTIIYLQKLFSKWKNKIM